MPLNGARADEQLRADLGVRAPIACKPRDMLLLWRELVACVIAALAHLFAGGQQLTPRTFRKPVRAHHDQHLVGGPQLRARVHPPVLSAQPLAVDQVAAGEVRTKTAVAQPVDRLPIVALGGVSLTQQRPRARLEAKPPAAVTVVRAG